MNKNNVIFVLVFLILVGGIWGSRADRKRIGLERELNDKIEQIQALTKQTTVQREQVLGKTAGLQETLAEKEAQLVKARKELVSLRKELKVLEAQLSGCSANLQKITQEKEALEKLSAVPVKTKSSDETTAAVQESPKEVVISLPEVVPETKVAKQTADAAKANKEDTEALREKLQTAELTIDRLRQKLDAANAQLMGLEKLLEEKNAAMEETSQDMDRLKINMDVLLSKIADQRDDLQEIQEENRNLVKELTAKNEEIADFQEEIMRQPVQE